MEYFQVIDFQRTRDFSEKLNATFAFVKQNFKSLFKSLMYIAGPPLLVTSLLFGNVYSQYISAITGSMEGGISANPLNEILTVNYWLKFGLFALLGLITGIILFSTVINFSLIYTEKRSNIIEVNEVWDRVKKTFFVYFWSFLGLYLIFILVIFILVFATALVATAMPLLGPFFLIGAVMYLFVASVFTPFIIGIEKKNLVLALARSFQLIRGKWWSTLGLGFVLLIIIYIVSFIPIIPVYIVIIQRALHSVEGGVNPDFSGGMGVTISVALSIYYLFLYLLSAIPQIGIIFQYYNLVERKESRGLLTRIGKLDNPQAPEETHQQEHY